jgi:hypothetical protein
MQENLTSTVPSDFNEQIENSLRDLLEKVQCEYIKTFSHFIQNL